MTSAIDQPARESNIEALVDFFKSGIKTSCTKVGIELEHVVVTNDGNVVSYYDDFGIQWLLKQLEPEYDTVTTDPEGDLLGLSRPGEAVTLEPAAQLELSAGPFEHLGDAKACFDRFENTIENVLAPVNEKALAIGYNPISKARDLRLIPKKRYDFMNLYLGRADTMGICMMRGSAATQVSIDYDSVDDCLRKMRIAYALVPILALICDNTPVFEGEPRKHQIMRMEIWEHVDNARCGIIPGIMDEGFTLEDYANYILDTPAILVPCEKEQWCYSTRTFGEIYSDEPMTRAQVEHALSMFFTDVRAKTYIEIRPADSMPVPYVIAYAGLIKGLFYDAANLDKLDALFSGVKADDIITAKHELMAKGYDGMVYGKNVGDIADDLVAWATSGLSEEERGYLEPFAKLVEARTTLANQSACASNGLI